MFYYCYNCKDLAKYNATSNNYQCLCSRIDCGNVMSEDHDNTLEEEKDMSDENLEVLGCVIALLEKDNKNFRDYINLYIIKDGEK